MKRLLSLLTASLLVSCSFIHKADAHGSSHPAVDTAVNAGIVTPDVATDGMRTVRIGRTAAGDTVLCPDTMRYDYGNATCLDTNGRSAFVWPHQVVPVGRKYVGFRLVSQGSTMYYEVYWK